MPAAPPTRSRAVLVLPAGAAGGLLVALSVPPFGWWPLGWAGLAVLAAVLAGRTWRGRILAGAGFGLGQYVPGLWWVQEFSVYGYVALVVVSTLFSVAAAVAVPAGRRRYVVLALPAALVLADWARDRFPLGGLPLAGLSLGQAAGPLATAARLGGSLAVTGLAALVGVTVANLTHPRRAAVPGLAAVAVLAVSVLSPSGAGGGLPPLRVGLVQGGGPRGTRAIATDPQVVFDRHLAASAMLSGPYDLIVWPEGVLQSHGPFSQSADAAAIAALARLHSATVVVGVDQDVGDTRYLNEVVAWRPDGTIGATYVKNHLVPFGEYIPARKLIERFFNVADVPLDGIAGHRPGFLPTPAAPLAVMISFEVFFDERARGGVRAGGQVLTVPTNTESYRSTQVPTQEVAADRLRAIETGRYLVQVTPTGYSTVVDPAGRVLQRSRLGTAAVVTGTVPRRTGMTWYDDLGDAPVAWAALAVELMVVGAAARRHRRPA
jgi:apolipoprotein N-acyltransferase